MPLDDLPLDSRPREKLLAKGAGALSDAELLALLLRTGIQGTGVLQMAEQVLSSARDSARVEANGLYERPDGSMGIYRYVTRLLVQLASKSPAMARRKAAPEPTTGVSG